MLTSVLFYKFMANKNQYFPKLYVYLCYVCIIVYSVEVNSQQVEYIFISG